MSQENDSDSEAPETPEEGQPKRFARHWKRRARIFGPFLGIPPVFGALALSMDLVSGLPQAQAAKAQAHTVKTRPLAKVNRPIERIVRTPSSGQTSTRSGSVIQPNVASIDVFAPNSISLEMTDAKVDAARIQVPPFREHRTR